MTFDRPLYLHIRKPDSSKPEIYINNGEGILCDPEYEISYKLPKDFNKLYEKIY